MKHTVPLLTALLPAPLAAITAPAAPPITLDSLSRHSGDIYDKSKSREKMEILKNEDLNKDSQDIQDRAVLASFLFSILLILSILVLSLFLPLEYTSPNSGDIGLIPPRPRWTFQCRA
jgi:hypothetical protein